MPLEELVKELRGMGLKTTFAFLSYLERGVHYPSDSVPSAKVDLLVGCSKVFRVDPEWFLKEHKNITEALPDDLEVVWTESLLLEDVFLFLGLNLCRFRKKRRWSQKYLAEVIFRTQSFRIIEQRISQIENPDFITTVTVDQLVVFEDVLRTSISRLLEKPQENLF
jgi:transcriptional regulator with XRE-family HTH domain